ncbi:HAD family phosphatase [Pseudomonas sp. SBB6]|uniref:HAD family hydrolase n=1 Tax=Pseudomonas sp. SBB6 TaxID=2962032 RepID=UPI0020B8B55F|nr:HAD-IB family phosphatase [Pseudomonas sp. SBB6]
MKAHVIFDFDQTLLPGESTVQVLELSLQFHDNAAQRLQKLASIAPRALAGNASAKELMTLLSMVPTLRRTHIQHYIEQRLTQLPHALGQALHYLQQRQVGIHIISGGYMEWIVPLAQAWGIEARHVVANRFFWFGSRALTIRPSPLLSAAQGKGAIIRDWRRRGQLKGPVLMVGDGQADFRVFQQGLVDDFICIDYFVNKPLPGCAAIRRRAVHPDQVLGLIRQALAQQGLAI